MAHIYNPFDILNERLSKIESMLIEHVYPPKQKKTNPAKVDFKFTPIKEIFENKICSKPTFYKHVNAGTVTLHKFGNRSFVDTEEFYTAFHKVQIRKNKNTSNI